MKLAGIYQCFCDPIRLRILHLLTETAWCVCHFQYVHMKRPVKSSKHLAERR